MSEKPTDFIGLWINDGFFQAIILQLGSFQMQELKKHDIKK